MGKAQPSSRSRSRVSKERALAQVQDLIASELGKLPDVFSTVQWGGRAYKLPGPRGNRKKPKLLAHVCLDQSGETLCVDFKLERSHARQVIEDFGWIKPHSFRTLAPSGWVSAEVRTKSQCKQLIVLLRASRALHPMPETTPDAEPRNRKRRGEEVAVVQRIGAVVRDKRSSGWSPDRDDFK